VTIVPLRRLVLIVVVFLVWTPVAYAWSWPVRGPVLQGFVYDESHPYAAGQHRGVDIGADAAGEKVVAPAAGTVTFAGSVPTSGECVTIQTADGYSVTLTHLGSILVAKGASLAEGDAVGTIGPSGTPEFEEPYVHLGVRLTSDPNGYLDPLAFLPAPATGSAGSTSSSQPSSSGQPAAAPAAQSTPASAQPAAQPADAASSASPAVQTTHAEGHASERAPRSRPHSSTGRKQRPQRPAVQRSMANRKGDTARTSHRVRTTVRATVAEPSVELAARASARLAPARGRQPRPMPQASAVPEARRAHSAPLLPVVLDGAAALVAVAAAFAARRRRRRHPASALDEAHVLHLPIREAERGVGCRAA
jgi:hypothetical protein